jgi:hypothetical protein
VVPGTQDAVDGVTPAAGAQTPGQAAPGGASPFGGFFGGSKP